MKICPTMSCSGSIVRVTDKHGDRYECTSCPHTEWIKDQQVGKTSKKRLKEEFLKRK